MVLHVVWLTRWIGKKMFYIFLESFVYAIERGRTRFHCTAKKNLLGLGYNYWIILCFVCVFWCFFLSAMWVGKSICVQRIVYTQYKYKRGCFQQNEFPMHSKRKNKKFLIRQPENHLKQLIVLSYMKCKIFRCVFIIVVLNKPILLYGIRSKDQLRNVCDNKS